MDIIEQNFGKKKTPKNICFQQFAHKTCQGFDLLKTNGNFNIIHCTQCDRCEVLVTILKQQDKKYEAQ